MSTAMERARRALDGLSVGDAFGERFFGPGVEVMPRIQRRALPDGPWRWTDDTAMALSIVEVLERHGAIDQDALARSFSRRHRAEPMRGYGAGAHQLLHEITIGGDWRSLTHALFGGMGSFGNGAAMRVAPLGAFFAGDLSRVVSEAHASAEVTHGHPEGIAGGVAVAVAAAVAPEPGDGRAWLAQIAKHTPRGEVHDGIGAAIALPDAATVVDAAVALGNGSGVTAPDTVPLCLWVVSRVRDYEDAMWRTVSALGDRDTTCAIVGGILGAHGAAPPAAWLARREPLG